MHAFYLSKLQCWLGSKQLKYHNQIAVYSVLGTEFLCVWLHACWRMIHIDYWITPMDHFFSNPIHQGTVLNGSSCGLTLFCRCISLCFAIKLQWYKTTSFIMTQHKFSRYLIGLLTTNYVDPPQPGSNLHSIPIFVFFTFISSSETVFNCCASLVFV